MDAKDDRKLFIQCLTEAKSVIRAVTKESETQQESRFAHDATYHTVIYHIANMYFLIRTNHHFQKEQEEIYMQVVQLLKLEDPLSKLDLQEGMSE